MEVTTAARRYMLNQVSVTSQVQQRVFKHRLMEKIDGTGKSAIVVKRSGGWASPDRVQTIEFPILVMEYWADHARTPGGEIAVANAEDRAWALHRIADPLLHAQRDVRWGAFGSDPGLRIVSAKRESEPVLVNHEDAHDYRAAPMGDSVMVSCRYALEIVH